MPESKSPKKAEEPQMSKTPGKPVTTTPVGPGKGGTAAKSGKTVRPVKAAKKQTVGNPRWLVPTMVTLLILGILWVVTFYLTSADLRLPIPFIGQWNIFVGFGLIIGGLGLATRWK